MRNDPIYGSSVVGDVTMLFANRGILSVGEGEVWVSLDEDVALYGCVFYSLARMVSPTTGGVGR